MDEARSAEDIFGEIRRRLSAGFTNGLAMERAVHAIHAAFQAQFMSAGGYGGRPWAQLAESTARRRPGKSYMILVDTGDLQRALTEPGDAHGFADPTTEGLVVGTDLEYAGFHQTGTARMPARELVTDQMLDQEGEAIADAIGEIILGDQVL